MRTLIASVLAAAIAGVAPAYAARCGAPSPPVRHPAFGLGLPLGPLFLKVGFGPVSTKYFPGYPTKVLIRQPEAVPVTTTLRGFRCADGRSLRFWYRNGHPFDALPATEAQLALTGDLTARLGPTRSRADFTGYMLFSAPGDWKLVARERGRIVGAVVVQVTSPSVFTA